ncbi:MAG: S-layer homology domain-containing protein [Lachnospiraceae bacterium]|nr:S-layer homology domain-containing protein [Lachnospiraceae bacterium]
MNDKKTRYFYLKKGLYCLSVHGGSSEVDRGYTTYTIHYETSLEYDYEGETYRTDINYDCDEWDSLPTGIANLKMGLSVSGLFCYSDDFAQDWYQFHVEDPDTPVKLKVAANTDDDLEYRIYTKREVTGRIASGRHRTCEPVVVKKQERGTLEGYGITTEESWDIPLERGDYYLCVYTVGITNGQYSFTLNQKESNYPQAAGGYRLLSASDQSFSDYLEDSTFVPTSLTMRHSRRYIIRLKQRSRVDWKYETDSEHLDSMYWELYQTDPGDPAYPKMTGPVSISGNLSTYNKATRTITRYLDPGTYSLVLYADSMYELSEEDLTFFVTYKTTPCCSSEMIYAAENPTFMDWNSLKVLNFGDMETNAFTVNFHEFIDNPKPGDDLVDRHIAAYRFHSYYDDIPVSISITTNIAQVGWTVYRVYGDDNHEVITSNAISKSFPGPYENEYDKFISNTKDVMLPKGEYVIHLWAGDPMQGQFSICVDQGDAPSWNSKGGYAIVGVESSDVLSWKEAVAASLGNPNLDVNSYKAKIFWEAEDPNAAQIVNGSDLELENGFKPTFKGLKAGTVIVYGRGEVTNTFYNGKTDRFEEKTTSVCIRLPIRVEFSDVLHGSDHGKNPYYYDPVYWAAEYGITAGIRDRNGLYSKFGPQNECSRAQMVSFLWRMAGCPEPKKATVFRDVPRDAYYYKAVCWASENGITGGYSDGTFRPNNNCSRAQTVTFLYRMAGCPKVEVSTQFKDVPSGTYYYNAVAWAEQHGITGGYSDGTFRPNNICNRGQMVTFLFRYRTKG